MRTRPARNARHPAATDGPPAPATRRRFLSLAASAVAPYFVPAAALGRAFWSAPRGPSAAHAGPAPRAARVRRRAASERISLGFIGVGNMGSGHLGWFLANPEVQIVAICDVDARKREAARKRVEDHYADQAAAGTFAGCQTFNEFERLLARDDLDAVLIAVPDHWHAIIAIAACRAGKDVYCEKPLSLTVREARAMVEAARRFGTVFQTGSQQRSESNFRYACELVRNGRIGRLQTVNVGIGLPSEEKYLPPEPVREGLDWDRWLGPAPWQPYNAERCSGSYSGGWRLIRDYSGGMTTDWGAHHFDIAQWGMGTDGSGPVEIHPPQSEFGTLTYRYADGVLMHRGGANGILFTGTDGRIEVNRGYLKTWPDELGKEPIYPDDVHLYESPGHQQDWLDCIRARRRPICDVAIGASSVTVCHLGNIACWLGRSIRWDPAREQIVGDEAAARWLDRPKRAPWRIEGGHVV